MDSQSIGLKLKAFLPALLALRQDLHRHPELSGEEFATAERIRYFMAPFQPDAIIENIGGYGLVFVFEGSQPGPTVLFRCELDALPIKEVNTFNYRSVVSGASHKCGHDGHMTIICALGVLLAGKRPEKGRVLLAFQGAEETGQGAVAMVEDPLFQPLKPDYAFALHNLPGHALGRVLVKCGPFTCASRGMIVTLQGKTSHAAHPEDGTSPMQAMCEIMTGLTRFSRPHETGERFQLATVVHARLGEPAFGTSPGHGQVMATLRTETNKAMARLIQDVTALSEKIAESHGLGIQIQWQDIFNAGENHGEATDLILKCARSLGMEVLLMERPHRWSEDFGEFSARCKGAMLALGSGEHCPQLHNPDYDFPDDLILRGTGLFHAIVEELLS